MRERAPAQVATWRLSREIVRRIVRLADPEKIVLFGSRARGDNRPSSDLDLLVIAESDEPRHIRPRQLYLELAQLPLDIDVDVLVYTPSEVWEWSGVPQAFVTTAIREGKVLYEKS